jgi:hypothetical protein
MLYAFTDESYTAARYIQGAFVVDRSELDLLNQIVKETSEFAQRFGIAPGTELRGYSIMNSKHGWEPLREKFHARIAVYKFLLSKIAAVNGVIYFSELGNGTENFETNKNIFLYQATQELMFEKLNSLCVSSGKAVSIFADEITEQFYLTSHFSRHSPSLSNITSLTFGKSSENAGIQIVDSLLYIYQRTRQKNINLQRSYKLIMELWELVSNLHEI